MQWRSFDQAEVPQLKTFILAVGKEVFFAKVYKKKIITKYSYADADKFNDFTINRNGADMEVFQYGWKMQGITPLWSHFHMPEGKQ